MTVKSVAKKGDRRDTLLALRDKISTAIDKEEDHSVLSNLVYRLQRILSEIDELPVPEEKSPAEQAREARAKRLAIRTEPENGEA